MMAATKQTAAASTPACSGTSASSPLAAPTAAPDFQPAVDLEAARYFLDCFEGCLSFQTFPEGGRKGKPQIFHTSPKLSTADVLARLEIQNRNGAGIFLMIAEGDGRGRNNQSVTRIRACFADFDGTPLPAEWPLPPHLVIESSRGKYHSYWFVDGLSLDDFKPQQKAIAARLNSDPAVNDLARVMRVPGFLHRKGEPFQTRIITDNDLPIYTARQIQEAFPATTTTRKNEPPASAGPVDLSTLEPPVVENFRNSTLVSHVGRWAWRLPEEDVVARALAWNQTCQPPQSPTLVESTARRLYKTHLENNPDFVPPGACPFDAYTEPLTDPQEAKERPLLAFRPVTAWVKEPPAPRDFLLDDMMIARTLSLLVGQGGTSKSFLALQLGICLSTGEPWGPFRPASPRRVMFLQGEDDADTLHRRLYDAARGMGLETHPGLSNLMIHSLVGEARCLALEGREGGVKATATAKWLSDSLAALGDNRPELLILDPFRSFSGVSENDNTAVNAVVGILEKLIKRHHLAIMAVHHASKAESRSKGGPSTGRGASALFDGARLVLATSRNTNGTVSLTMAKTNHGRMWPTPATFSIHPGNGTLEPAQDRSQQIIDAVVDALPAMLPEEGITPDRLLRRHQGKEIRDKLEDDYLAGAKEIESAIQICLERGTIQKQELTGRRQGTVLERVKA